MWKQKTGKISGLVSKVGRSAMGNKIFPLEVNMNNEGLAVSMIWKNLSAQFIS